MTNRPPTHLTIIVGNLVRHIIANIETPVFPSHALRSEGVEQRAEKNIRYLAIGGDTSHGGYRADDVICTLHGFGDSRADA